MELRRFHGRPRNALIRSANPVAPDMPFPPLGVPADLQSAVKKCPNLFMLWGFAIPIRNAGYSVASDMPVRSAGYARPPLGVPADMLSAVKK